ncbi:MAG: FAD-dependent oxidoreductase [Ignavibacteriales bacterium]|nr:FAD-dependent oxidoreductase [Ignavibacteriales bacterium]
MCIPVYEVIESKITEFVGEEKLESIRIENQNTNELSDMKVDGVFIFIGYVPNTEKIGDKVTLNKFREIIVDNNMATNIAGVYAAGDSIAKRYRQVTTAVADGTIAALSASEYVNNIKKELNSIIIN